MSERHGQHRLAIADKFVTEFVKSAADQSEGTYRVVQAPAGAGKTGLVTRLASKLGTDGAVVGIITQTNEQANDLVRRYAGEYPGQRIARLHSKQNVPGPFPPNVEVTADAQTAVRSGVVVTTSHKWAYAAPDLGPGTIDVGIVDEAYQMGGSRLLYLAEVFPRFDLVGDPGQLDPFTAIETDRWTSRPENPTLNAVETMRQFNDPAYLGTLPVTRRLPVTAADLVREAFYIDLDFGAATVAADRQLGLRRVTSSTALDQTLECAVAHGWAHAVLPSAPVQRTDRELASVVARLAGRALERGIERVADDRAAGVLTADRIAIGAAHRDQCTAVRSALADLGVSGVVVDTANRLQGREFDLVIAWHPLSGELDASSFHLDIGRLCVLTTRHRHACIVVSRRGITDLLDTCVPSGEGLLGAADDRTISGWEANAVLLDHLEAFSVAIDPSELSLG